MGASEEASSSPTCMPAALKGQSGFPHNGVLLPETPGGWHSAACRALQVRAVFSLLGTDKVTRGEQCDFKVGLNCAGCQTSAHLADQDRTCTRAPALGTSSKVNPRAVLLQQTLHTPSAGRSLGLNPPPALPSAGCSRSPAASQLGERPGGEGASVLACMHRMDAGGARSSVSGSCLLHSLQINTGSSEEVAAHSVCKREQEGTVVVGGRTVIAKQKNKKNETYLLPSPRAASYPLLLPGGDAASDPQPIPALLKEQCRD